MRTGRQRPCELRHASSFVAQRLRSATRLLRLEVHEALRTLRAINRVGCSDWLGSFFVAIRLGSGVRLDDFDTLNLIVRSEFERDGNARRHRPRSFDYGPAHKRFY